MLHTSGAGGQSPHQTWASKSPPAWAGALVALACYVVIVLVLLPHNTSLFAGERYVGEGSDPTLYIWGFAWWPYAITHGINPLLTHVIWASGGADIAWNGTTPSLALLAWPMTALVGPVVSYNIVALSAPVLAALAAYVLCYELTKRFIPALVGGWLFGFSTYEMAQLLGHLHLTFTAEIPLLVWVAVLRYRGRIGTGLFVLSTALLLSFDFGVGVELFTTTAVFGALGLVASYLLVRHARRTVAHMALEVVLGYVFSLILISPYLYFFFGSASGVPPIINPPVDYSDDLLNFVIPTPVTALGGQLLASVTSHFVGNYAEEDGYFGVPLIAIVCLFVWRSRRKPWTWVLASLAVVVAISALGPHLHVLGKSTFADVVIRLPWIFATKLPGLRDALPGRLAMYLSLLAAVMVSMWIATLSRRWIFGAALVVATVASLWPNPLTVTTPPPVKLLSSKAYVSDLGHRANLLFLPYGSLGESMLWQALDRMEYKTASGTGTVEPASFQNSAAVKVFFNGDAPPTFGATLRSFCRRHAVTAILVTDGTTPSLRSAVAGLGWRSQRVGSDRLYLAPEQRR